MMLTIGNKKIDNSELLVSIPMQYRSIFENYKFKDMHEFSIALMYANCANEASIYNNAMLLRENENSLKMLLA